MKAAWRPATGEVSAPILATWPPQGTMNSCDGLAGICSERRAMASMASSERSARCSAVQ